MGRWQNRALEEGPGGRRHTEFDWNEQHRMANMRVRQANGKPWSTFGVSRMFWNGIVFVESEDNLFLRGKAHTLWFLALPIP